MENIYDWLVVFLRDREAPGSYQVNDFVPSVFRRYFFVQRNYGIIDDFPFDDYPVDKTSIDNLNKQHNIERQFGLFLNQHREHLYKPISIKDLAARLHVPYSPFTIGEIKQTPGIALLTAKTTESIDKLISAIAGPEKLNLYAEDYYRYAFGDTMFKARNIINDPGTYIAFLTETYFDSYSYLFPDNHSWCLATVEDFNQLILACDDETASKLTAIEGLEYVEASAESSLFPFLNRNAAGSPPNGL